MSINNEFLTGRTRYRPLNAGVFRKETVLVLQVETKWGDGPPDSNGLPIYLSGSGWRDARVEDLCQLKGGV